MEKLGLDLILHIKMIATIYCFRETLISLSLIFRKIKTTKILNIVTCIIYLGAWCLQCEVGLNNETKAMDCKGSWEEMQAVMKDKLGDQWDNIKQNMTTGMTGVIMSLKENFNKLTETIQNILPITAKPDGDKRRKRDTEEAAPEPEPEPEDDYYCIKQSAAGHTIKSCLPKVEQYCE